MNIPIVYEDEHLLIVDKPSGLLTIPTPRNERRTLTSILNDDAAVRKAAYRLHPCHRLDRETSGLIVYAKGKAMQKQVMELFKAHRVAKTYIAFVNGTVASPAGRITLAIQGAPAETRYRLLRHQKGFSVVEATLVTGRTNQIRIHFKALGNPVLGDDRFAFRKDFSVRAKRLCLHAWRIAFTHPATQAQIQCEAPLPPHMAGLLEG